MHTIKGGWVGQTFAMALCSDSGGKKSRIRRSKEERKTMVESFIKKYQTLNNGNFPSLNLTHKEVGGSFYTVREIVREIIQENRVLGPAILPFEEEEEDNKNNDMVMQQHFPLGSIAVQPLICSPLGVSHILHHVDEKSQHILNPNEGFEFQTEQELEPHFEDVEAGGDSMKFNEQVLVTINEESHHNTISEQFIHTEKEDLRSIQVVIEKNSDFIKEKSNNMRAEVVVETFPPPPRPVTQILTINGLEGRPEEDDETKNELENISYVEIGAYRSTSEKVDEYSESLTKNQTLLVDDGNNGVINEADVLSIGKLVNTPPKDRNENTTLDEQITMATTKIEPSIVDDDISSSNKRHPTLDRTKLETWEGTSKKPSTTEIESIIALFKSFIVTVVKFFTE